MVSNSVVCAFAALAFLAVVSQAAPLEDDSMALLRIPRAAQRQVMQGYVGFMRRNGYPGYPQTFAHGYAGARTQEAPVYAMMPVEDEEEQDEPQPAKADADEEPQQDEEEAEEPLAPVAPTKKPSRTRPVRPSKAVKPQRPARPTTTAAPAEEEDYDEPAVPAGKNKQRGGTTAVATAISRGDGASALSNAVAYGGAFSGGVFRHRIQRGQ